MEIRQYIAILRRRSWLIIGVTVIGVLVAAALSYLATPSYRSSTTVRVATIGGGLAGRYTDILYSERLMNTYSQIVTGGNTMNSIKERLQLQETPIIDVEVVPNTELLQINVEASSPEVARDVADATAQFLIQESRELYAGSGQSTLEMLSRQIEQAEQDLVALRNEYEQLLAARRADSPEAIAAGQSIEFKERTYNSLLEQYEQMRLNEAFLENAVTIVEPAVVPEGPATPRTTLNLLLGAILGMMAGVTLALLRENLDTRLYTVSQIEAVTKAPVSGHIPAVSGPVSTYGVNSNQPLAEAYRRLRINLLSFVPDGQPYAILITSASEGEGKSTVAANLAVSIAKSGRSVVVVDCNMHDPVQHTLFDVTNDRGLTNCLTKQANVAGILQSTEFSNLKVIANGTGFLEPAPVTAGTNLAPPNLTERLRHGSELLGSVLMRDLLGTLKETFDIILLDTPAMTTVTDAAVLVPYSEHVMLVVAQSQADREAVRLVRDQFGAMNVRAMSVVINRVGQRAA